MLIAICARPRVMVLARMLHRDKDQEKKDLIIFVRKLEPILRISRSDPGIT